MSAREGRVGRVSVGRYRLAKRWHIKLTAMKCFSSQ